MPNIKSAIKRVKTSERDRLRNRSAKSAIQTVRQQFLKSVTQDASGADASFRAYCSVLDKSVKRGIVSRNTASRRKQRMALKLNAAQKTA